MQGIRNSRAVLGAFLSFITMFAITARTAHAKVDKVAPVVGGTGETDNKFTWIVNTSSLGGGLSCQGVLIAPRWVLTAAHCIGSNYNGGTISYSRTNPLTGVKSGGSQQTGVNSTFKNPGYMEGSPDHDIALVRLPQPFPPDPLLQPAELPVMGAVVNQTGAIASFSHSTSLPKGQLAVLRAPILLTGPTTFISKSATASLCPGDSGSGFMTLREGLNVVTGIASQAALSDCNTPNLEFTAVDVFPHLSWILSITGPLPANNAPADIANADYDGDGKIDLAVKTALGDWKIDFAANGYGFWDVIYPGYGFSDAHAAPADYDGDRKADLSIKTDGGVWYIDYAANGFGYWDAAYSAYGWADAHPVPADYDGDGKADLSVKTDGGVWYIDYASNGFGAWNASYGGYGWADAHPVPADYDGDGKADLSVKTDGGVWYIDYASNGFGAWNAIYSGYGWADAHPVPVDYDGDGRADLSVKADGGVWYVDYASNGFGAWNAGYSNWGGSTFIPIPGDYDGDRKADVAVYNGLNNSYLIDFAKDGFGAANIQVLQAP